MKTLLTLTLLTLLTLVLTTSASAQTADDNYHRNEFSFTFSHGRIESTPDTTPAVVGSQSTRDSIFTHHGFNGFAIGAKRNVSRYVGFVGEVVALIERRPFPCPGGQCPDICLSCPTNVFDLDARVYEALVGMEFKDNAKDLAPRLKPFFKAEVGVATLRQNFVPNPDDPNPPFCPVCQEFDLNRTGIAFNVGGGLDLRLSRRFDLRVLQVDYNPTRLGGGTQNNFRFGAGLVVH